MKINTAVGIGLLLVSLTACDTPGKGKQEEQASDPYAAKAPPSSAQPADTGAFAMDNIQLESDESRNSYAIGRNLAQMLQQDGVDLELIALYKGISDGLGKTEALMTDEEVQKCLQDFGEAMRKKQMLKKSQAAQENIAKGKAFLEENAKRDGVTVTDSGLQYEVITAGTGPIPKASDKVTTHYHGTLIDGTVFDSSYKRGQPASFPVGGVIQGWQEALQLMPQGSKWKLFIPSDLAYGDRGAGGAIGPGETLVFDIELLEIN